MYNQEKDNEYYSPKDSTIDSELSQENSNLIIDKFFSYLNNFGLINDKLQNEIIQEYNKKSSKGEYRFDGFENNFKMMILMDIYFEILFDDNEKRNDIIRLIIEKFNSIQNKERNDKLRSLINNINKKKESQTLHKNFNKYLTRIQKLKQGNKEKKVNNFKERHPKNKEEKSVNVANKSSYPVKRNILSKNKEFIINIIKSSIIKRNFFENSKTSGNSSSKEIKVRKIRRFASMIEANKNIETYLNFPNIKFKSLKRKYILNKNRELILSNLLNNFSGSNINTSRKKDKLNFRNISMNLEKNNKINSFLSFGRNEFFKDNEIKNLKRIKLPIFERKVKYM